MKILVTGGGGFLGTWLIKELLKNPRYMVTNFSRHAYDHLADMGVPTVRGDVANPEDVSHALSARYDAIFHVASMVGMWGKPENFERVNITGTETMLKLAKEGGVKAFVYTSTPSVVFGKGDHAGGDETMPYASEHLGHYPRTKAAAEEFVLNQKSDEFKVCAIRPHLIWGPGDPHLFPGVIKAAKLGKLKVVGDGENLVDVIYVENAAKAHVLALENLMSENPTANGQAYFLGQENPVKLWDFVAEILKNAEVDPVEGAVSLRKAYAAGWLMEKLFLLAGIWKPEPPMTRFVALNLGTSHYYSHAKAERDLGWKPEIPIAEGMKRTFADKQQVKEMMRKAALN